MLPVQHRSSTGTTANEDTIEQRKLVNPAATAKKKNSIRGIWPKQTRHMQQRHNQHNTNSAKHACARTTIVNDPAPTRECRHCRLMDDVGRWESLGCWRGAAGSLLSVGRSSAAINDNANEHAPRWKRYHTNCNNNSNTETNITRWTSQQHTTTAATQHRRLRLQQQQQRIQQLSTRPNQQQREVNEQRQEKRRRRRAQLATPTQHNERDEEETMQAADATETHDRPRLERAAARCALVAPREPFFAARMWQVAIVGTVSNVCGNSTCIEMQRKSKRSFRTLQQLQLQEQHQKEPTRRPNTGNTKEPATTLAQSSNNDDDDDHNQQEPTKTPATETTIGRASTHKTTTATPTVTAATTVTTTTHTTTTKTTTHCCCSY
jgi:hypothetical protein